MRKLDTRLVRHIRHHKGQFIAIAMVIILGLMIYVAMNSAYENLEISLEYHYETHNFSDVFSDVMKISESDVVDLKDTRGVKSAEGRLVYDVPLNVKNDEKVNIRLISSKFDEETQNSLYAREGQSTVQKNNQCLVIDKFAEAREIQIGDYISPHISGSDYELEVIGIVSSPEYVYLMENEQNLLPAPSKFGVVYTTESFIKDSMGINSYNQVTFLLEDGANVEEITNKLEKELEDFGLSRIFDAEDQLSNRMIHEEMKGLKQSARTVPLVFLGVAAFILAVMINRLVKGDRLSIGILKSMGYSNRDVLFHYTKLSVVIGFFGGVFGVVLGYIASAQFTAIYNSFFSIPTLKLLFKPELVMMSAVMVTLFSIASGLLGARKSLKISPAESMRPEPPKNGKRIFIEGTRFWKLFSFSNKMVLRNLFRSKRRTLFLALGISLTFAITLVPFFMFSAFTDMFGTMFGEFQTMDYSMNFVQGKDDSILYELRNTLDVDHLEGKLEFPFELHNRWKSKVTNIIGLEDQTKFFSFKDTNLKSRTLGEGDFFLSEGLAKVLDIKEGDYITVESFIPDRDDIEIKVTKLIKQNLGANGYMLITDMQKLLLDEHYINGAYVDTDENIKSKVEKYRLISSVQSSQDLQDIFNEFLALTLTSLSIFIVFGGTLGFAIVYNSAVISINERRLEFSSLRVMGFTKNEIFISLLKENIITAFIGILLGIPIARSMLEGLSSTFSTELYSFDINLQAFHYFLTAVTTVIFVIIALGAAYKKIHGLDFIEALKNRIT
ncbi:MAG: FtsX-like permease family protein [Clostridiales bacterium]|nr:FtsX-like permease family protein [Clostridiales bacterium]